MAPAVFPSRPRRGPTLKDRGRGLPGGGCGDDQVRNRPACSLQDTARERVRLFAGEAFPADGAVVEKLAVQAAATHDDGGREPRQLFGSLVPVHDRAPRVHDVQAVLDLVEEIAEGNLREY